MRLVLSALETRWLAGALSALFPPPPLKDPHAWGTSVMRALRALVGMPKAVFVIAVAGTTRALGDHVDREVVRAYEQRFAALDVGLRLQESLGLEVWSQAALWERAALVQSEYYKEFARPHRMHDPIGLAVAVPLPRAEARLALFREVSGGSAAAVTRQLALLRLVLPAFKAGVRLHAQSSGAEYVAVPRGEFAPLLDAAEEAFELRDAAGKVLYANRAMARELEASGAPEGLRLALAAVARETVCVASAARSNSAIGSGVRGLTARVVHTPGAEFHVRGSIVASNDDRSTASRVVLVSLRRSAPAKASLKGEDLRARFRLTIREAQIAALLLHRDTNAEIARALAMSPHTARHHTERILRKLGVHSRTALGEVIGRRPGQEN